MATIESVLAAEQVVVNGESEIDNELLLDALRQVYDPEIPVNIVDLGLVYGVTVEGAAVNVTMTLTAIGCPVAGEVMADVQERVKEVSGVAECQVDLTFEPMWTPERMTEDARWELGM